MGGEQREKMRRCMSSISSVKGKGAVEEEGGGMNGALDTEG